MIRPIRIIRVFVKMFGLRLSGRSSRVWPINSLSNRYLQPGLAV